MIIHNGELKHTYVRYPWWGYVKGILKQYGWALANLPHILTDSQMEAVCRAIDVCSDTLETWCKRTYKRSFSEVFAQKRGAGKISLRRSQWKLAEKNANMAIWLGKQYLGQKDQVEASLAVDMAKDDALSESLREMAEELESDG